MYLKRERAQLLRVSLVAKPVCAHPICGCVRAADIGSLRKHLLYIYRTMDSRPTCQQAMSGSSLRVDTSVSVDTPADVAKRHSVQQRSDCCQQANDPLKDPAIRYLLSSVQLSREQLMKISVRDLNKRLNDYPVDIVAQLKRCRRTLKNRGYAKNCRIRRIATKDQLEQSNAKLKLENQQLVRRNKWLADKLAELSNLLRSSSSSLSSSPSSSSSLASASPSSHQSVNPFHMCTTNPSIDNEPSTAIGWPQHSLPLDCCQNLCRGGSWHQFSCDGPSVAYCNANFNRSQTNFY